MTKAQITQSFLGQWVLAETRHQVLVNPPAPVVRDLVGELLTETGASPGIRQGQHVTLGGPELDVPAGGPGIHECALRTAMYPEHQGRPFCRIKPGGLHDPHLDRGALGARERDGLGLWQIEFGEPALVGLGHVDRRAALQPDGEHLGRLGHPAPGEDYLLPGHDRFSGGTAGGQGTGHAATDREGPEPLGSLVLGFQKQRPAVGRPDDPLDRRIEVRRQ